MTAFTDPTKPNLPDFIIFVRNQGVTTDILPDGSPYFSSAYTFGKDTTLTSPGCLPSIIYVLAVYNLGMHKLIKIAPDTDPSTYFVDMRKQCGLLSFVAGPVIASADESTSETLLPAEWLKDMTLSAADALKTSWGRDYLEYANSYGSTVVELS